MFKFSKPAANPTPPAKPARDPYRDVMLFLSALCAVAAIGAAAANAQFGNIIFVDLAATMVLSAGLLGSVALTRWLRTKPLVIFPPDGPPPIVEAEEASDVPEPVASEGIPAPPASSLPRFDVVTWIRKQLGNLGPVGVATNGTAATGLLIILFELNSKQSLIFPNSKELAMAGSLCLGGAGMAAIAARYFGHIAPENLPEAQLLCRGARVTAWLSVLGALSMGLAWLGQLLACEAVHLFAVAVNFSVCYSLLGVKRVHEKPVETIPLHIGALTIFGSRNNILASVTDAGERSLGIDLRSTWALTVVRESIEPLVIGLCLLAWLSTSLTVVGLQEQGLLERLGVPAAGPPLAPGLHAHLPWPIDTVIRIPVLHLQKISVGHEGEEEEGPENVLWARQHAANEYTLLLGNGRDLITIDAAVLFRISDSRAWHYHTQNPVDALRAIAYRAVMRSTVNKTLSEALSENLVALTNHMREVVQQDADALGLGVDVVSFTVGGMHPPVMVANSYERVVSAQIRKVASVVNAQVYRNHTIPAAEIFVINGDKTVRSESATNLAKAAGEAWSFRTMMSQYRASPQEYFFRRRLETLEKGLQARHFTIVDARFLRDGGELWIVP